MVAFIAFIASHLGISKFLTGTGLLLILILVGVGGYFIIQHRAENRINAAQQTGVYQERAQQSGKVIEDVKKANDASHIRDPSRDQRLCKQDSRTPANCQ